MLATASMFWVGQVKKVGLESRKLLALLPIDEEKSEIPFLPSMRMGHTLFDDGRERLLETALVVVETHQQREGAPALVTAIKQLMQAMRREFGDEETEMERLVQKNYMKQAMFEKHKEGHLLLRQRLTYLFDLFKTESESSTTIALRIFVSLFDAHFTDEDQELGECLELRHAAEGGDAQLDAAEEERKQQEMLREARGLD
jgi:hemerythrin